MYRKKTLILFKKKYIFWLIDIRERCMVLDYIFKIFRIVLGKIYLILLINMFFFEIFCSGDVDDIVCIIIMYWLKKFYFKNLYKDYINFVN